MANTQTDYNGGFYAEKTDMATSAALTAAANSGLVTTFTANATATLPAAAAGLNFRFKVGKAGLTVKIKPASTETFIGAGITATASYILTLTNAPAGSTVEMLSNGTNWYIAALNLGGAPRSVMTYAAS